MKDNLCETCKKVRVCFQKGIFERESCEEYEPLSVEEQLEREEFVNAVMGGSCPKCGGENTIDCEYEPSIDDITVGACLDCRAHWCLECGYVFEKGEKRCPHWGFCAGCSTENGYMDDEEFLEKICLSCEHFDKDCQLEDPSKCEKEAQFLCPHREDISSCPRLGKHLREGG